MSGNTKKKPFLQNRFTYYIYVTIVTSLETRKSLRIKGNQGEYLGAFWTLVNAMVAFYVSTYLCVHIYRSWITL
jgi:hypothetical protein